MAGDLGHVADLQAVTLHDLQQRIGRRVRVAAGGMPFERGLGRGPARAQAIGEAGGSASVDMPAASPAAR
jgi:hypothetical protein